MGSDEPEAGEGRDGIRSVQMPSKMLGSGLP